MKFFDEAEVTIGPIYDISQIVAGRLRAGARGADRDPDADMGELPTHPVVPRLSGTPGALKMAAPQVGEHNEALLKPLLGEAEYEKLRAGRRDLAREREVT